MISIITPVYNREHTVVRLFKSIKDQTVFNEIQWIIVDDGSTDDTLALLHKLCGEYHNITVLTKPNGGKHTAVNLAMCFVNKPYFTIIDSDDYLSSEFSVETIFSLCRGELFNSINCKGLIFPLISHDSKAIVGSEIINGYKYSKYDLIKCKGDKGRLLKYGLFDRTIFPEYSNERFYPESAVWLNISNNDYYLGVSKPFITCEYQSNGLSANYSKVLSSSPRGVKDLIKVLLKMEKNVVIFRYILRHLVSLNYKQLSFLLSEVNFADKFILMFCYILTPVFNVLYKIIR